MLAPMGIKGIVQPAQSFERRQIEPAELDSLESAGDGALLVFTSPRAVEFGLPQLPTRLLAGARIAAIGPATARELQAAGRRPHIEPLDGYTSEALLEALDNLPSPQPAAAFVVCAPGGRDTLLEGLASRGLNARPLWVYERRTAEVDPASLEAIAGADRLLSVFTSGDAMQVMSQRLPPAAWFAVCRGEWLVVSGRLRRLARAFGPSAVHIAGGPQNTDLATAIRSLS